MVPDGAWLSISLVIFAAMIRRTSAPAVFVPLPREVLMSPLLAKANNDPPDEFLVAILAIVCGVYLVELTVFIFFFLTLHKALGRCQPRNRTMEPGLVWLNLIPLFDFVWMFITVIRVSESLENEFRDRRWHRGHEDYGKTLGIVTCAVFMAGYLPYIGCLFFVGWLVCFILYWVKIVGYSGRLASRPYRDDDDYDDEYDYDYDYDRRRDRDDNEDDRGGRPWDRGAR